MVLVVFQPLIKLIQMMLVLLGLILMLQLIVQPVLVVLVLLNQQMEQALLISARLLQIKTK